MDRIPEISDALLSKLCARIKPVYHFRGKLYFIKPVKPRGMSFIWHPKKTRRAVKIVPMSKITTYHTWAYYGFFKPSIAEVIAQIPSSIIDHVTAFEIVDFPRTAADLNRHKQELNEGYHVAVTQLYGD